MGVNALLAWILGVIFTLFGFIGLFSGTSLMGFGINLIHTLLHLVTGIAWIWGGYVSDKAKQVNSLLGLVYLLLFIMGYFQFLGFLNVNTASNVLHLIVGVLGLWVAWKYN